MTYKIYNSGIPTGIQFKTKEIKRQARPTPEGQALVVILDRNIIGINDSYRKNSNTGGPALITVMYTISTNRCLIQTVKTGREQ